MCHIRIVGGAVSIYAIREPNGLKMWGSPPAAATEEEAHELVKTYNAGQTCAGLDSLAPAPRRPNTETRPVGRDIDRAAHRF